MYQEKLRESTFVMVFSGKELSWNVIKFLIGLWELCSKFLSLFYSEFLSKSQLYSFYAAAAPTCLKFILFYCSSVTFLQL